MSTAPVRTARPSRSGPVATPTKTFSLSDIVSKSKPQPTRYAFYADGGFGKTSFATYFPSPVFLMTKGETGLLPLIETAQVPATPHFPELQSWAQLLEAIDLLRADQHTYKTLVLDTANGAERMCYEAVCDRDFKGDWGNAGFGGYMRGYEVSMADWRLFLNKLDALRLEKNMTIVFLMHMGIRTFKNPSGADYDRYVPEMKDKAWGLTKGWLDCILFGNYEVTVSDGNKELAASKKGKASSMTTRMLYAGSSNPTFDAKNRMGLPDEIPLSDESAKDAFKAFADTLRAVRSAKPEPEVVNG